MSKSPKGYSVFPVSPSVVVARLYNTNIVEANGRDIKLNSGGWRTMSTKKCMNIFLKPYNAYVFQKKGEWYVSYKNDDCTEVTELFRDNMQISVGF